MNTVKIAEEIRYLIETEPGREWRARDLSDFLGYRGHRAKLVSSALAGLVEDGVLKVVRPGVYTLNGGSLLKGRLELARSGAGFVTDSESGKTYRVDARDVGSALPGDTVSIRVLRNGADADTARIVKVESASERMIVGTFFSSGKLKFVVPFDPVYRNDIAVADAAGAKEGDRVVVRLVVRGGSSVASEGEIVEVIGPADKPSLDTDVVCRQYELPGDFPAEVVEEAATAPNLIRRPGKRLDLRKEFILTVDPATARDFDDAISFSVKPDGTRSLGVHIADVGFFVREGSALDKEAAERGTSVYLVDKVIPMLPEQLCNGICSLRPDEDRLCMSVFMDFDKDGKMISRRFARTKIRSHLRLTYEQALALIEDRPPEGLENCPAEAVAILRGCAALTRQLRAARMKAGALDLDVPECAIILDEESRMTGIKLREYDISHQMIEECMVVANEAVAAELSSHGIRILSRLHESPDPSKIEDLTASLRTLGFRPGDISHPKNLSNFIASIADEPLHEQAHTMILRSMKRAVYSAEATGHFGLAKHYYSHFTSPIRRYPDLILHRQLADYLAPVEERKPLAPGYLKKMAIQCTDREQRADDAERALLEVKKYRFLKEQIEAHKFEEYDAVISKVTSFGLFVDVNDLQVGGLIHISSISNNYVRYDKYNDQLSADGVVYKLGGKVRVIVANVDFMQRKLDFALVRESAPKSSGKKTGGKKSSTKKPFEKEAPGKEPVRKAKADNGSRGKPFGKKTFGKKAPRRHPRPSRRRS